MARLTLILMTILCVGSLAGTVLLSRMHESEKTTRLQVETQNTSLKKMNDALEVRSKSLKEENDSLLKKIDMQTQLVTKYKEKADEQQSLANKFKAMKEELEQQLKNTTSKYKELQKNHNQAIEDYKNQNQDLLEKIKELKSSVGSAPVMTNTNGGVQLAPVVVKSDTGLVGKVMVVNRKFNFIISNIGKNDGLQIGDQLVVSRDGRQIGAARVEKLYDALSASAIVGEQVSIQEGDLVLK